MWFFDKNSGFMVRILDGWFAGKIGFFLLRNRLVKIWGFLVQNGAFFFLHRGSSRMCQAHASCCAKQKGHTEYHNLSDSVAPASF